VVIEYVPHAAYDSIPEMMERLVVVRGGALGDFILGLPLLDSLRAAMPCAHLTLVGPRAWLPLAWRSSVDETVVPLDDPSIAALYAGTPVRLMGGDAHRMATRRRHAPSTVSSSTQGQTPNEHAPSSWQADEPDLVLALFRTADRAFELAWRELGARRVVWYPPLPPPDSDLHAIDHLLKILPPLGMQPEVRVPVVEFGAGELAAAARWCISNTLADGGPLVALHPGSGGRWKCWAAENFGALARRLTREVGARVLLVLGPADEDLVGPVMAASDGAPVTPVRTASVRDLAALLRQCTLFIGNDSGVTHLAAATGCPTVALFGPTYDRLWAPVGPHVLMLRGVRGPALPPDSPAFWPGRPIEADLTVEDVLVRALDWRSALRMAPDDGTTGMPVSGDGGGS